MVASSLGYGSHAATQILWNKSTSATTLSNQELYFGGMSTMPPLPPAQGGGALGPQSASAIYQHIHDMSSKRISTLDYLRKA